ncbi:formylglycine-generating enzyme family protein [Candidatus Electronema sp. PJ]|uniref:formylglycine-generating enzyme family protein n=1 Tax=Candidatus Electronema sp. PJ TaxID=3401572 RepID=UPI003AA7AFC6
MKTASMLAILLLASAAQAADYRNSLGMEFNTIPAGTFFMGSCMYSRADKEADRELEKQGLPAKGPTCPAKGKLDEEAYEEEAPQHEVTISQGFQLGVHEITLGQFKQYLATLDDEERDKIDTAAFQKANAHGDTAAVTYVSWRDAQAFIAWLNQKEGSAQYRLPTEAEWEYAARAGTSTIYFWGDAMDPAPEYAWFNMDAADLEKWFALREQNRKENYAHPVGLKKANPWGLYDMSGNVWEWVNDWYDAEYYHSSPASDPIGPEQGRTRCFRGGSWYGSNKNLRSAFRGVNAPEYRSDSLGFRLVRQLGKQ